MNIPNMQNFSVQRGATLVITLIVLLVLTTIAVALTNSNQTQATMVRNNQFRLEAFNAAYTEIDAQIDSINTKTDILSSGYPIYVYTLVNGNIGDKVWDGATDPKRKIPLISPPKASYMDTSVSQFYHSKCKKTGEAIGAGKAVVDCNRIRIEADATLKNTSVKSDQKQVYELLWFAN